MAALLRWVSAAGLLLAALVVCAPPWDQSRAQAQEPAEEPSFELLAEMESEALPERALRPEFRKWLEEVAPLINEEEREAFVSLPKDYQRQAFIEKFWRVRDPFPETARNELREAWKERVELARSRLDDISGDRGRMMLLVGPPAEIVPTRCSGILKPVEVWRYSGTERLRREFYLVFYDRGGLGDRYRLWSPRDGIDRLLAWDARPRGQGRQIYQAISDRCFRGDNVVTAIANALDWERLEEAGGLIPHPGEEWLLTFLSSSTDLPAGAATFEAELALDFPGRHQNRTVVQGTVAVPRSELPPPSPETGLYNLLIDGEIVRKENLFESFRYRFQLPSSEIVGESLPLVFERSLRPGTYTLFVRVQDLDSGSFYRTERLLEVPAAVARTTLAGPGSPSSGAAPGAKPKLAAGSIVAGRLTEANASLGHGDHTLKLNAPPPQLLVGNARVEAITSGEGIDRVRFYLNGQPALSKRRPPFSVEIALGTAPKVHILEAVAEGPGGEALARDQVILNAGPHRFAIRLIEPRRGGRYQSSLRARAEVDVPEGERLERVEFFLNDDLLATLYQPPFVQPVLIPEDQEITYVRAAAYLTDGNSTEDLVFVNSPEYLDQVDVTFVELFTTVVDRRGRPVAGLEKEDFRVTEEGKEQEVRRFETIDDLPIYAGIVLDTSASMVEELNEAVNGALKFFNTVLTPKDRAAVITFNDRHELAVRFTNDPEMLAGGLAGVVAEGDTNLYDSLIYAFYYFSGIKGKRAVILLSDGADVGSRYTYEETLDYARRTGVSIYTIGLGLTPKEQDIRFKLSRLAEETGGQAFFVDHAYELDRVYDSIEGELRTQYLLAYQSPHQSRDTGFRTVEVEVLKPGLEAKTIRGYFP